MSSTYLYSDNDTTYDMSVSSTGTVLSYTDITTRVPLPSIQANANKYLKVRNDGKNLEWDDVVLSGGLDLILDERTTSNPPSILFEDVGGTQYNTGINMYRDTTNANNQTISFYANNTKKLDIAENRIISKEEILGVDGTVTNPSYSFESDPDCGIYRTAANQVGIACNGGITANFTTTQVQLGSAGNDRDLQVTGSLNATGWCRTGNGTAASPVYTFTADQDSGMYRVASNQVGISAGGTAIALFSNTGVDVVGNFITTPPAALTGASYVWNDLVGSAIIFNTSSNNIQLNLNNSGGITSIGRTIKFYKNNTSNNLILASTGGNVRLNSPWGTDVVSAAVFPSIPSMSGRNWLFEITRSDANIYHLNSILITDNLNTFQAANSLTVNGTCNANIFRAGDGTTAIPSYSFTNANGTDCGLTYNPFSTTDRIYMNLNGARVQMWNAALGCEIFQDTKIATEAGGARNLTVAGNIYNSLGTNSLPSYSFTGDTDTGIYSATADTISFATNATNRMNIDNVGVTINSTFRPQRIVQYGVSALKTASFNTNTLAEHIILVDSFTADVVITLGNIASGAHFTIIKTETTNALQVTNVSTNTYNGSTRTAFTVIAGGSRGIFNLYQIDGATWYGFVNTF